MPKMTPAERAAWDERMKFANKIADQKLRDAANKQKEQTGARKWSEDDLKEAAKGDGFPD